jgi:hypothetical protein
MTTHDQSEPPQPIQPNPIKGAPKVPKLPPYTLVRHDAERYAVVVIYTNRDAIDSHNAGPWAEPWPVAAWTDQGEPLVMDHGLMTIDRLLERYTQDSDDVSWDVRPARGVPGGPWHL